MSAKDQKGQALLILSPREREIMRFRCRGRTVKEIATDTALSPHTVKSYLERVFLKLNCRSSLEAAHKLGI